MWTANCGSKSVDKDHSSGAPTTYGIGGRNYPLGIAFDGTNMWAADSVTTASQRSPLRRHDHICIGGGPEYGIAFRRHQHVVTANLLPIASQGHPSGATTTYGIGSGTAPYGIAFDGTNMWAVDQGTNSVTKVTPSYAMSTPTNGTTYTVGQTIGSSTVACVVASSTSSCTDTGLTNGTQYYYKIFAYDAFTNYSTYVTPTGRHSHRVPHQPSLSHLNTSTVNFPVLLRASGIGDDHSDGERDRRDERVHLFIQRNSATSTIASGTIAFPDYTSWGPSGSTCASGQGNGTTTPGNTLSFRVASSGTTANYCAFWWGASDSGGTAIYAGVPTTTQIIVNSTSSASQNGTTAVTILYSANAPTSQKATSYTGGVTITAIANP